MAHEPDVQEAAEQYRRDREWDRSRTILQVLRENSVPFYDYLDGAVQSNVFSKLLTSLATTLFPNPGGVVFESIQSFDQSLGPSVRAADYIFGTHDGRYRFPTDGALIKIVRGLKVSRDIFDAVVDQFKEILRIARLAQMSQAGIEGRQPHHRRLERMLDYGLARPSEGGRYNFSSGSEMVTQAIEHVRLTKGYYADSERKYKMSIKGSLSLEDVVNFIALCLKSDVDVVDALEVVLNASWGREKIQAPFMMKRHDFEMPSRLRWWERLLMGRRNFGVISDVIWWERWPFMTRMEGAHLAEMAFAASRAGRTKRAAIFYSLLAEEPLWNREEKKGYYEFCDELERQREGEKKKRNLSREEERRMIRRQQVKSMKKRAERERDPEFRARYGPPDSYAMTAEDRLREIERENRELLESTHKSLASSALRKVSKRKIPMLYEIMARSRVFLWVQPYHEARRAMYGIVAIRKWLEVAQELESQGSTNMAKGFYSKAQQVAIHTHQRMQIALSYADPRFADETGRLIGDALNPLIFSLDPMVQLMQEKLRDEGRSPSRSGGNGSSFGGGGSSGVDTVDRSPQRALNGLGDSLRDLKDTANRRPPSSADSGRSGDTRDTMDLGPKRRVFHEPQDMGATLILDGQGLNPVRNAFSSLSLVFTPIQLKPA